MLSHLTADKYLVATYCCCYVYGVMLVFAGAVFVLRYLTWLIKGQ